MKLARQRQSDKPKKVHKTNEMSLSVKILGLACERILTL